jgi:hypothetical protein
MSAYALPGFFPPIEGLSFYSNESCTKESKTSCSSESSSSESSSSESSSSESSSSESSSSAAPSEQSSPSAPLHETQHFSTSRINVLGDAVKASVDKLSHMLSTDSSPGIAVKEAKIDPMRLVQYVTNSSPQKKKQQKGKTLRKRGSRERLDANNHHHHHHTQTPKDNNNNNNNTSHDEAIEFELSISFNGRKYNATRTMQCIVQLRNDLIWEMKTRKQWIHSQCRGGGGKTPPPQNTTKNTTRSSSSSSLSTAARRKDDAFDIPEIPPLAGEHENKGSGFVGRGFSMLHAMATSYVPVMESWLRNVLTIVPQDSECLINFLWEPMNDVPALESAFPLSPSMLGLDSIKELDGYNTGDEDSEDEWGG